MLFIEQGIVIVHKELRCPECRVLVETRLDELPPNILLIRLLEGIKIEGIKNNGKLSVNRTNVKTPTSSPQAHDYSHQTRVQTRHLDNGSNVATSQPNVHSSNLQKPLAASVPRVEALFNYDGKEDW